MTRIVALLAGVAGVALATALPVEGAGKFTTVPAKHGKCKKGWTKKTIRRKGKKVKVCVKRRANGNTITTTTQQTTTDQTTTGTTTGTTTQQTTTDQTTTGTTTGTTTQTTTGTTPTTTLQQSGTSTRDDAAGQAAMQKAFDAYGALMLERSEWGSVTATYYRIWFWPNGQYKYAQVDWMQEMGEKCNTVQTGSWTFKEGYRFTLQDGRTGVLVKVGMVLSDGRTGDDVLAGLDNDPNHVYVGAKGTQYDVNPNMMNNC